MRRLVFEGPGKARWEEVAEPELDTPAAAIVRPLTVATCDLDIAALDGRYPMPAPYPLGHEGVAEVVAVGPDVRTVAVGDRVVVPFQISCGACVACRRGFTGNCRAHPWMSTFGLGQMGGLQWGGLLADLALVPHADAMLVPLPAGMDPVAVASASDNIPDGWRAVGPQLAADPGADVFIAVADAGSPSIGLYAAGMAVTLGAGRVLYLDDDPARREIATALGAEVMAGPPPRRVGSFPITVDASGTADGLRCAIASTFADGICTCVSVHVADVPLPMFAMYSRGITLNTGRCHSRAALPAVLDAIAAGFRPELVTTHVTTFDDAPAALGKAAGKVVFTNA